ncbi:MAG TPA: response regulator transcription factor [Ktedonobacterales bacterium]|jgi:DNA-binding response OmpR family regulator
MTQPGGLSSGSGAPSPTAPIWRILIVDDEEDLGNLCQFALSTVRGYVVRYEQHPLLVQALVHEWQPDLIILDVMMPELDGIILGKRLKEDTNCHADLMFVTSSDETETELDGLELAEEYVTKPVEAKVLLLRVRNILRRRNKMDAHAQGGRGQSSSRPTIDLMSRVVHLPDGRVVTLTPTELRLLVALLDGNGQPVSYAALLKQVWGLEDDEGAAADESSNRQLLQVHMARLRKKIEARPRQPEVLVTVPRGGYCFVLRHNHL